MISDKTDSSRIHKREPHLVANSNSPMIQSLVTGSISSTLTTIVYQPLELLKTRIQLQENGSTKHSTNNRTLGKVTRSTINLVKNDGLLSLWKGTGASVIRSGPGVGLYYSLLNILQNNYSDNSNRPNDAAQAFYFGLCARSMVSFVLLPVTVIKVRYESGHYQYGSLFGAIGAAYTSSNGWVGLIPTVLRDSIFSGTYYMTYTQLKARHDESSSEIDKLHSPLRLFSYGILSGLLASFITNPIDVLKTAMQAKSDDLEKDTVKMTMRQITRNLLADKRGFMRFFDGLDSKKCPEDSDICFNMDLLRADVSGNIIDKCLSRLMKERGMESYDECLCKSMHSASLMENNLHKVHRSEVLVGEVSALEMP